MHRIIKIAALAVIGIIGTATAANASVTVNSNGTGFVGRRDDQTVLGLNNAQLQNTPVEFTRKTVTEQEFSWDCVKYQRRQGRQHQEGDPAGPRQRPHDRRHRRPPQRGSVRNRISGYNLTGFDATSTTSDTDGPAPFSCPNDDPNLAELKFALDADSAVTGDK
jgi:hypothetical protein